VAGTIDSGADRQAGSERLRELAVVVAARDEEQRIAATLAALAEALPGAALWVADDGSRDATARVAAEAGARVVSGRRLGKGGAMTAAVERVLAAHGAGVSTLVLCDGDLGASAARLAPLVAAVREEGADIAVAVFAQRVGGGFGLALAISRLLIRRLCGFRARAPLSGQRALTGAAAREVLPFAAGFGMEVGMTIDAVRAGRRVVELEVDLAHRASGRSIAGFAHRARQLLDVMRAAAARR
jgi:hypothetical protein